MSAAWVCKDCNGVLVERTSDAFLAEIKRVREAYKKAPEPLSFNVLRKGTSRKLDITVDHARRAVQLSGTLTD